MTTRLLILTIFLIGLLVASCHPSGQDNYPKDRTVSNENGEPKDSLTFYFPTVFKRNGQTIKTEIDTFLLQWYSSSLFAFKERVLHNFYLGHDSYRFLWLRSFHKPAVISLDKDGDKVWLTTKELDRQPEFMDHYLEKIVFTPPDSVAETDTSKIKIQQPQTLIKANRHANIIINQTKILSKTKWEKFERLLKACNFWTMKPVDRQLGFDGAEWILEAHFQEKYLFVDRWSPGDNNYSACGKYLIELSGLKEEIY